MCKKCEKNWEGEPHTGADISEAAAEPNRPLPWHVVDRLSRLWFVLDGKTRPLAVCFEAMVHLILYGLYSTNNAYQYDSLLIVWTHYKANCFDGLSQSRVLFFFLAVALKYCMLFCVFAGFALNRSSRWSSNWHVLPWTIPSEIPMPILCWGLGSFRSFQFGRNFSSFLIKKTFIPPR
jgi:hypothetical protein